MSHTTLAVAALALLVLLGMGLEVLQRKKGVPDAIILLALGALAARVGGFEVSALGPTVPVFTTCALILLLFESALDIQFAELRGAARGTLALTCVSFLFCMLGVAAVGVLVLGLRPVVALLLGSILGGTSTSVVVPLVRGLALGREAQVVLTLESALNDVLCVVFTLALLGASTGEQVPLGPLLAQLGTDVLLSLLLGAAAGGALAFGLRAVRPHRASLMFMVAAVFLAYALAEALTHQGALACLALGVVLANAPVLLGRVPGAAGLRLTAGERAFASEGAFLTKVLFFVLLGARFQLESSWALVGAVLAVLAMLAARPWAVRLSLSTERFSRRDAAVASVLLPKGMAAAVLATLPAQRGLPEAGSIATLVAAVIVVSILVSNLLAALAARKGPLLSGWVLSAFPGEGGRSVPATPGARPMRGPGAPPSWRTRGTPIAAEPPRAGMAAGAEEGKVPGVQPEAPPTLRPVPKGWPG